ncbi:MAG: hypothetical protein U1F27_14365 [Turneriella sp.]
MSDLRRLIIEANAAEQAELFAERRSHVVFFLVFGGGFAVAAIVMLWPFKKIDSFHWMVFSVLMAFFALFLAIFLYQLALITKSLSAGKSVMYVGTVTRRQKVERNEGYDYLIWIGDRQFDVAAGAFEEISVGQTLAVREWLKSGQYIEHTLDKRRIAELEKRATAVG